MAHVINSRHSPNRASYFSGGKALDAQKIGEMQGVMGMQVIFR
jgi:hypothetical protein